MDNEKLDICPKCYFDGIRSKLPKPIKTKEGWVSTCEKGHKIYAWAHFVVGDGLIVDELEQKAYSITKLSKN